MVRDSDGSSSRSRTPEPGSASLRSSASSLGRRFTNLLPISRKSTRQVAERAKNEFGLNTVYQPPESSNVIADLVFVHGLGGGSSTTWCIHGDPESFWPKEWLPKDPDFDGVRVRSFGYNANWSTRAKTPLDVRSFGQSLVEELISDPMIKSSDTPIVLLGHSMGGLVIKQACILSKTNRDFAQLAQRFHSFYFLGTPHRGANLAKFLGNLIRISGKGRKPYVQGLESQSEIIRSLNDSFRVHYAGICLHSFYESQPTPPVGLIVDMESATLGYAEERPQLLNANHKNLIKFRDITDTNYRSLRNRLAATMEQIRANIVTIDKAENHGVKDQKGKSPILSPNPNNRTLPEPLLLYHNTPDDEQLKAIYRYLSMDYGPEEALLSLDDTRLEGSCSWLPAKPSYQEWLRAPAPRYFYLKGAPASGKSIMSSYIIRCLKQDERPTCYYFFKAGEKTAPNLSIFLRSMAYQMATVNPTIRDALFYLALHGPSIDIRNVKSIWYNIFTSCIFNKALTRPHFWVIDALDEATQTSNAEDYFLLLSKIDDEIPLKVFVTSRPTQELDHSFTQLPTIIELITPDDSMRDIQLYVNTWSANLPVDEVDDRNRLVDKIVRMSGGSFLWTVLIMKKLRHVLAVEEIHDVLNEVPQRMNELYQHNIEIMENSPSKKKGTVKHIIIWAICAVQPLTVDQMREAIKLSQNITLSLNLRTSLQSICGQFLDVDKHSRIQVVHETARAFLTDHTLDSEFRVDYSEGHGIIAASCLEYLLGDEMKYSKWRRSLATAGPSKSCMTDYACLRWSEHVVRSTSSSDRLFELLVRFFQTNVLSWIERVAQLRDLECLNRTSRHLSSYLGRRTKYTPILPRDLNAWVVDLPRIVTQFGTNLVNDPASIHTLIPPFCPRDSAIHQTFGYAEDGIKLVGAWNSGWDDRVCSISFHETYTREVAARDHRFAVGLADGLLKIYSNSTCQELFTLDHAESLSVLDFGHTAKYVASAGLRRVRLWDANTGKEIFNVSTDSQTLAVALNETETSLIVASRDRSLAKYQISDGTCFYKEQWMDTFIESKNVGFPPSPSAVRISIELQVMAVVYRSQPVQLWSLDSERPVGACIRPTAHKNSNARHIVHSAVFNPSSSNPGLLVSYWDDVLEVYDVRTCRTLASTSAGLDRIAIAPNGKTIAGSDGTGGIKIFDFETLQFLHRIQVQGDPVTSLVFGTDGLRIIDVRGTHANVWEPLVLVSQDSDSRSSEPSESVHHIVDDMGVSVVNESAAITALQCCEESGIAFCGRNNGSVDTCNLDDPEKTMRSLYSHRGNFTSVTCIGWACKPRIAASADSSGRFRIMQITTGARREWGAEMLTEGQLDPGHIVSQVLVHPEGLYLLVSSSEVDSVWCVRSKERVASLTSRNRVTWKWFVRPSSPPQLLLFEDRMMKLYNWADLSELASAEAPIIPTILGRRDSGPGALNDADAISISSEGDDLVFVEKLQPTHKDLQIMPSLSQSNTKIHVFDLSFLEAHATLSSRTPAHFSSTASTRSSSAPPRRIQSLSHHSPPPQLHNPFSTTPLENPPNVPPFHAASSLSSAHRRSSVRNVADVPNVERIVGTVKRFNSWFLIFISREGWVCSVELGGSKVLDTFEKHFFVPTVWRTANSTLITKVRRNQDIIFIHQDGVIVIKNGLDNGRHVSFS
ncbi:hypothetical protein BFJ72_g6545 [Fusarium proliferatum]|uniref:Uncharacterized protein n=1 Tax=Gibberella intermedia TaxID=948311 RepID=A0A420TE57_GIBIN|nr:hypothetical protein BFJ72_g6545 [Fusarium proliferatum]